MKAVSFFHIGVLAGTVLLSGCQSAKTPTDEAMIHFTLGEYEQAAEASERALIKNPSDPYALMIAGISYDNLGYPNKSRRYYEDLMETTGVETGAFGQAQNLPPQDLRTVAAQRLTMMENRDKPYAVVDPQTGVATFREGADKTFSVSGTVSPVKAETFTVQNKAAKGGFDMLSEKDRNVVQRFLTFIRLRDEKLVTETEWQARRTVNLGALLPYSMVPAGLGLDLPSPPSPEIVHRLDALRSALELRAITPREHAVERETILNALLPANPQYRMAPMAPPKDVLDGAEKLRRLEMLLNAGLITPKEAEYEKKVLENLLYARLGMTGGKETAADIAPCMQKCMKERACPCAASASAKKAAPAKKPAAKKKAAPAKKAACACPVTTEEKTDKTPDKTEKTDKSDK